MTAAAPVITAARARLLILILATGFILFALNHPRIDLARWVASPPLIPRSADLSAPTRPPRSSRAGGSHAATAPRATDPRSPRSRRTASPSLRTASRTAPSRAVGHSHNLVRRCGRTAEPPRTPRRRFGRRTVHWSPMTIAGEDLLSLSHGYIGAVVRSRAYARLRVRAAAATDADVPGLDRPRLLARWVVEVRLDRCRRANEPIGDLPDRQALALRPRCS
jgi:hypothetical protein